MDLWIRRAARRVRGLVAAACLAVLAAGPARAQAVLDTTVVLPGVTVTATRAEVATASAPSRVTVLTADDVEETGARSVAELLAARSAGFVRAYGAGGLATLSLRGAAPEQTLVLLDGHRIVDPQLGQLDLALLPTLLLEGVEVMHGAGSPLYGAGGLGGVVNLRTLRPGGGRVVRASGGYGAYGERSGGVLAGGGRGRLSGLALVEVAAAEGDYPYHSTAFFPPRDVRREGADRLQRSAYGALRYEAPGAAGPRRLRLAAWYHDAERGLPTIGSAQPRGERQWDEGLRLWADAEARRAWGTLRAGAMLQQAALRYANPQIDVDDTGRTRLVSFEAEAQVHRLRRWLVAGGVGGGVAEARHPRLSAGARDVHAAAFAHGTGDYGRLLVFPALRADAYVRRGAETLVAVSPRLGASVRPFGGRALRLKASAGRAFRVPTFNQRFWQGAGKPDLRPEHGWTADAGAYAEHAGGRAELTVFAAGTRDQIMWTPTGGDVWTPDNLHRTRMRGLELSVARRWTAAGRALDAGLHYTFTDARDRSDPASASYGEPLLYVPREQLKLHATAALGPVALDLDGRYTGRRYTTTDGSAYLDPYVVVDAQLRLTGRLAGFRARLALAVANVFDARYAVVENYPMPPRHARLRLLLDSFTSESP